YRRLRAVPSGAAPRPSTLLLLTVLSLVLIVIYPTYAQPSTPLPPPVVTSTLLVIPSPSSAPSASSPPITSHQGITTLTDYHIDSPNCTDSARQFRVSLITHATALTSDDIKLDAKTFIPLTLTDVMSGVDYDAQRMSAAIYDAVRYPVDALIVSIPDYDVLKAPILAAKDSGIPVIAVYTGLQAAKDMGILAVMSDEYASGKLIGQHLLQDGVKDFVCINGPDKIPTLLDRCKGVLDVFVDAGTGISSNMSSHVLYVEKSRNSSVPMNAQSLSDTIRSRTTVTGIIYLTAPIFTEMGTQLTTMLNNTRPFKIVAFDFNKDMTRSFDQGLLHYSISSLMYIQTFLSILLLYVQLNHGEKINQDQILTGPKLVTPSNAKDMLEQETWSATNFRDYSNKFS
ncbi:hypothetical protein BGZ98_005462, partial [Dissophora globulifera]